MTNVTPLCIDCVDCEIAVPLYTCCRPISDLVVGGIRSLRRDARFERDDRTPEACGPTGQHFRAKD